MRRAISSESWSLKAAGAERVELSIAIATSALFLAGRVFEPEKITSSMDAARMDLCEDSPMTHRNASTRFDFPQPFGPTTPVRPGSIRKSVGSTKDLKPSRRSRVSFMRWASPFFSLAHDQLRPSLPAAGAPRIGETRARRFARPFRDLPGRFGVGPENESTRLRGQLPSQSQWWFSILFGDEGKNTWPARGSATRNPGQKTLVSP